MSLFRTLFPLESRGFPGGRWLRVGLRSLHLLGTAGVGGGFLYGAPPEAWLPWLWLTVASGAAMMALELWSNGVWIVQMRGLAMLLKLALLALAVWLGEPRADLLIAVILISGIIAHAPARLRYYSPWHRRRIESL